MKKKELKAKLVGLRNQRSYYEKRENGMVVEIAHLKDLLNIANGTISLMDKPDCKALAEKLRAGWVSAVPSSGCAVGAGGARHLVPPKSAFVLETEARERKLSEKK